MSKAASIHDATDYIVVFLQHSSRVKLHDHVGKETKLDLPRDEHVKWIYHACGTCHFISWGEQIFSNQDCCCKQECQWTIKYIYIYIYIYFFFMFIGFILLNLPSNSKHHDFVENLMAYHISYTSLYKASF